ncbi:MAG: DUF58 domain-containing protein [Candidatus Pelagadaptatus aseana]
MNTKLDFQKPAEGAYTRLEDLLNLRFVAGDLRLSPLQLSRSQLAGGFRTRFRGRGMEFEEVRHYQAGDDIRSIDWRVTARTQVTHTKLFREERERPVILMVDQRPGMFFGSRTCFKSVLAAHCAAILGWVALGNNDRIGGLIFNDTEERDLRPQRNRHAQLSLLQEIDRFNHSLTSPVDDDQAIPLAIRLNDLRRIAKPGSAVVIISDFSGFDSECEERLYQLSRHCDVTLLHIVDPLEQNLPASNLLTISNGRQRRRLNSHNRQLRDQYQQAFEQERGKLQQSARRLGLPQLSLTTELSAYSQLQSMFGKKPCRR